MPNPALASCTRVTDLLRAGADAHPDRALYRFLPAGDPARAEVWSWAATRDRALGVAAMLHARRLRGERVLLAFPPGLPFVAALLGCLEAGVVAVPAYPPNLWALAQRRRGRATDDATLPRLEGMAVDAAVAAVLTTGRIAAARGAAAEAAPTLAAVPWLATDVLPAPAKTPPGQTSGAVLGPATPPPLDTRELAFLQYTSGSTRAPRGVMVTHGNLLAQFRQAVVALDGENATTYCSWLPHFHDMGLVTLLHTLALGGPTTLLAPLDFLSRPVRWLRALSATRAAVTGAPNFAWDLCVRRVSVDEAATLDLSGLRVAFNSSEPIRPETQRRFAEHFAVAGFDPHAFVPAWGLAEATLGVTWAPVGRPDRVVRVGDQPRMVVGRPRGDVTVAAVDPQSGRRCPDGAVGELWVRGSSVAAGYWGRPDETAATFGATLPDEAGAWLRTGDLGTVTDGRVVWTGRLKDLVVVAGRNHHPHDLEHTAEGAHAAVRPDGVAVFAVDGDAGEEAVIVAERDPDVPGAPRSVAGAVARAVERAHAVPVREVVLVAPRALPRTSSGKLRRGEVRARWAAGTLERVDTPVARVDDAPSRLAAVVARVLRVDAAGIDPAVPLAELGLDSLRAVALADALLDDLGREVELPALFEGTVESLGRALARGDLLEARPPVIGDLPADVDPRAVAPDPAADAVLLTGATGFVGIHILQELLDQTSARVICVVRADDPAHGHRRVRDAMDRFGVFWSPEVGTRIEVVVGDLGRPRLGLDGATWRRLSTTVGTVVHAAAAVNWSLPASLLHTANVVGTERVLRFACTGVRKAVHHVSSLAVHPEGALDAPPPAEGLPPGFDRHIVGYHRSKWLAEHRVFAAGARGLPVAVYRPDFVGGHSESGVMPVVGQIVPALLRGCVALGLAPDLPITLGLVPVDTVARSIVALMPDVPRAGAATHHLTNPAPMPFAELWAGLAELGYDLEVVPYAAWRARVRAITTPSNPLYPLKSYFAALTPERLERLVDERGARAGWPDAHTRARLGTLGVSCPAADRDLFGLYTWRMVQGGGLPDTGYPWPVRLPTPEAAPMAADQTAPVVDAPAVDEAWEDRLVVIGAGLAANLLAAYFTEQHPEVAVTLVGPSGRRGTVVGEGLVEASTIFLNRCGLLPLLHRTQAKKYGVTFQWRIDGDTYVVHEKPGISPQPEFFLNRDLFDRDVRAHNAARGVGFVEAKVVDVALGRSDHTVAVAHPDGSRSHIRARWVVDASGMKRFLGKRLKLTRKPEFQRSAFWLRLRDFDPAPLRDQILRMRERYPNTLAHEAYDPFAAGHHICGEHHWIWLFGLRSDDDANLCTLGITWRPDLWQHDNLRSPEALLAFLEDQHPALAAVLRSGEVVDHGVYLNYLYHSGRHYSPDGWYVIGDAANTTDPFLASGLTMVGVQVAQVEALVRAEREGRPTARLAEDFEAMYQGMYHAHHRMVAHLYETFGDAWRCALDCHWMIATYYYFVLPWLMRWKHTTGDGARAMADLVQEAGSATAEAFALFGEASERVGSVTPDQVRNWYPQTINFDLNTPSESDLTAYLGELLQVQRTLKRSAMAVDGVGDAGAWVRNEARGLVGLALKTVLKGRSPIGHPVLTRRLPSGAEGWMEQAVQGVERFVAPGRVATGRGRSVADRLRELTALRDEGLVDDATFARKRDALLDEL